MPTSDWTGLVASSREIAGMYDSPPDLSSCDLGYLHIDERQTSVTIGFDTGERPQRPPRDGQQKGVNAFEFYLLFTHVADLRVEGWGSPGRKAVTLSRGADERIHASIGDDGSRLEFTASSARVAASRGYMAASGE